MISALVRNSRNEKHVLMTFRSLFEAKQRFSYFLEILKMSFTRTRGKKKIDMG